MVAQYDIFGGRPTGARPVIIDLTTLSPGPDSSSIDMSRRPTFTAVGRPSLSLDRAPVLSMQWSNVVSDFPVAYFLRSIERTLLAPANINETRMWDWPELIHYIEYDKQQNTGYLMSYEAGEDAREVKTISSPDSPTSPSTVNNSHTWSATLSFSLAPYRSISVGDVPSLPTAYLGSTGSIFKNLIITHASAGALHSPSSVRWSMGGGRTNQYTVGGESVVVANFREPGELSFSWSSIPDVIPGQDPWNVSTKENIMLTRFEAYRNITSDVSIWGYCPTDGAHKKIADAKVLSVKHTALGGQPPRYDAEIRVALKAAR